ncbi:uncharacterized protein LOC142796266 isoform X2 [Rhipicephalus microplus]|uniref:uncharacterized protein LOC142796266 isoform X2 n=1 Tax=Rhipicephalus microplus TaxID=6941 RepID=UPI003F6BA203
MSRRRATNSKKQFLLLSGHRWTPEDAPFDNSDATSHICCDWSSKESTTSGQSASSCPRCLIVRCVARLLAPGCNSASTKSECFAMAFIHPCAVLGCKSTDWKNEKMRHLLPRDATLRNAWLERIGLTAKTKRLRVLRVCGRHFAAEDYIYNPRLVQELGSGLPARLRPKALPTLFLPKRPALPPKKGNCKSNQGGAGQTHMLHRGRADAAVAPLHRRYRRLAPLGIPPALLPIFLASQSQYSQVQEVTAALASDGSDYELPNSSKCHCKCHPETSTKAVQTHTMVAWTHCVTSTQTYVTKVHLEKEQRDGSNSTQKKGAKLVECPVPSTALRRLVHMVAHGTHPNMCRCSCHCMMSTAAVQTTPFVRRTSCSQTNESFISATMTRMDADCLRAHSVCSLGLNFGTKPCSSGAAQPRVQCRPTHTSLRGSFGCDDPRQVRWRTVACPVASLQAKRRK